MGFNIKGEANSVALFMINKEASFYRSLGASRNAVTGLIPCFINYGVFLVCAGRMHSQVLYIFRQVYAPLNAEYKAYNRKGLDPF